MSDAQQPSPPADFAPQNSVLNQDQALSLLRQVLGIVGTTVVAQGYMTNNMWALWSGLATAILPLVWAYIANRQKNKISMVANMANVQYVVMKAPADAMAHPSPKVIALNSTIVPKA